jgi:rod shape-determining protein MreC
VVPIFTYRDERKLFTLISGIVIAALILILQISSVRSGKPNPIIVGVTSAVAVGQMAISAVAGSVANTFGAIFSIPRLWQENGQLRAGNTQLEAENTQLRQALTTFTDERSIERIAASHPRGVVADTIGYDPENLARTITINRGSLAGITTDEGVISAAGIVGRVIQVTPFACRVLLITDPASKVPAVVQKGRWWGIAGGTDGRVQLQYISQDAPLRIGDVVVTGEGLSFHAGLPIGRIAKIYHSEGALYQTALLEPAVAFGRLGHVLVVPK